MFGASLMSNAACLRQCKERHEPESPAQKRRERLRPRRPPDTEQIANIYGVAYGTDCTSNSKKS